MLVTEYTPRPTINAISATSRPKPSNRRVDIFRFILSIKTKAYVLFRRATYTSALIHLLTMAWSCSFLKGLDK